jgi:hypothetical protein
LVVFISFFEWCAYEIVIINSWSLIWKVMKLLVVLVIVARLHTSLLYYSSAFLTSARFMQRPIILILI